MEESTADKDDIKVSKEEEGLASISNLAFKDLVKVLPKETLLVCNSQVKPSDDFSFSAPPVKKKYSVVEQNIALAPLSKAKAW